MAVETSSQAGPLGALNAEVRLSVGGFGGIAIQIQGTFTGTITFEATVQGQDFTAFRVTPVASSTQVTTATAPGLWTASTVGFLAVRARMSLYTDGQAIVYLKAATASPGGAGGGGGSGTDVNLIEVGGSSIASDQSPVEVTGSISATNPSVSATGDPVPADATFVGVDDGAGELTGLAAPALDGDTGAGTQKVSGLYMALPASGGAVWGGTATNPIQVGDAGGTLTVDGTVTAAQATAANLNATVVGTGTFAVQVSSALPAGNNNIGDVDVASSALPTGASTLAEQQTQTTALGTLLTSANFAAAFGTAGTADTQVMSVQGIASMTPVQVSQATASNLNATVVGTGTFAAQVTAVGTVADDGTTPGAPVMVGGFAKPPDGTDPGSVSAEDDVARFIADLNRRQYVNTVHPRFGHKHLDGSTAYTDESIVADPGDGFQVIITNIIGSTGAATALNFFLEEGSTKIFGPIYLEAVAGRGFASGPIHLPVTKSTAVTLTSSASIAQSFDFDYFIQAVPV
jgi:hypothetical protein